MASTILQVRIDDELREKSREIFSRLGLDMSSAVRLFLNRTVMENGIPFPMTLSNQDDKTCVEKNIINEVAEVSKDNEISTYVEWYISMNISKFTREL